MKGLAALCVAAVLLAGCGSKPQAPPPAARTTAQTAALPAGDAHAVSAPIPALLLEAQRAPYAEPADGTCAGITTQVQALDALLGADLDVAPTAASPSLIERGAGAGSPTGTQQAAGAADSVPPRLWVQRTSGAERYSRDVAAAIAAGGVRRSYLKGMGAVRGCRPPAAPATTERP